MSWLKRLTPLNMWGFISVLYSSQLPCSYAEVCLKRERERKIPFLLSDFLQELHTKHRAAWSHILKLWRLQIFRLHYVSVCPLSKRSSSWFSGQAGKYNSITVSLQEAKIGKDEKRKRGKEGGGGEDIMDTCHQHRITFSTGSSKNNRRVLEILQKTHTHQAANI